MRALITLPIWITVDTFDAAVDFAQQLEKSARLGALAQIERDGFEMTMEEIEQFARIFPAQVLVLPEVEQEV